jgi:NTE family protein
MLAGWVPAGVLSTDSISDTVRRAVTGRWVEHRSFWAVTCDYSTGRRVPFGRIDAPNAHIADAVAASCAIPGFFRPVKIGRRRYVDGGVCSVSNVDLLAGRGLDVIVCLNPLSSPERMRGLHPLDRLGDWSRAANGRRLGHEIKKVARYGTETVLIQPTREDLEVMGRNLMSVVRRQEMIETAARTVRAQLREPAVAQKLRGLPPGEAHKIRRPAGPPSEWPGIVSVRRAA